MSDYELTRLKAQVSILKDIARDYPRRTIENIINNIDARIRHEEVRRKEYGM